jgi:hypothetical protein
MSAKRFVRAGAAGLFLLTQGALAQEVCGVSNVLLKDGFEDGALPPYVTPADSTPLSISIVSPANGATVGTERVLVVGSYTGPPNTGVVAGAKVAANSNTAFVSVVRLNPGANSISAQLFSIDGAGPTATHSITYDAAAAPRVSIAPTLSSAIVPFTSRFILTRRPTETLAITRAQIDFDGNGTTDVDTTNVSSLSFAYQQPGLFAVSGTITLDDTDPGTPPELVPVATSVLSLHPQQTRFALCSLFGKMRTRIAASDIPGALNALVPDLQPTFQALWTSLGSGLPATAPQLGTIVDGRFTLDQAEYLIARPITGSPGQSRAYRVQFVRDDSGVWRIQAM